MKTPEHITGLSAIAIVVGLIETCYLSFKLVDIMDGVFSVPFLIALIPTIAAFSFGYWRKWR